MNAMEVLPLSKAECRQVYLQKSGGPYDKIVIGTIIAKRGIEGRAGILLLKRAAHEDVYPNIWEIPGGKVEDSDPTILDAVKREVVEETGIKVLRIIRAVRSFDYTLEKIAKDDGEEKSIRSTSLQLNFICEVAHNEYVVNLEEHSEGQFTGPSTIKNLEMTDQMRAVVDEGFVWTDGYLVGLMTSTH